MIISAVNDKFFKILIIMRQKSDICVIILQVMRDGLNLNGKVL